MPKTFYDEKFYTTQSDLSFQAASIIVPKLVELFKPSSVVDVGCGLATWLSVFKLHGISKILGIDGDYVNRSNLRIPKDDFQDMDLCNPIKFNTTFDLALCLEVAEHLPENKAWGLIELLTTSSSVVVFSAAIPGQGGRNHINEQWPDYWKNIFESKGYKCFDMIRPLFWDNPKIEPWYSQNIFVFLNEDAQKRYIFSSSPVDNNNSNFPLRAVHPELFNRFTSLEYINSISMIKELIKRFKKRVCVKINSNS